MNKTQTIIGVFANDMLLTIDLMVSLQQKLSDDYVLQLFSKNSSPTGFSESLSEYFIDDLDLITNAEYLILLNYDDAMQKILDKDDYEQVIIDATGLYKKNKKADHNEFIQTISPVELITMFFDNVEHLSIGLPVSVLGKPAVDDLFGQTRAIYTMRPSDSEFFEHSIAFGFEASPDRNDSDAYKPIKDVKDRLVKLGFEPTIKLLPVTVPFYVDLFGKNLMQTTPANTKYKNFEITEEVGVFNSNDTQATSIYLQKQKTNATVTADYLGIITELILNELEEFLGDDLLR